MNLTRCEDAACWRKVLDANGDDIVTDSAGRACHHDASPSATSGTATTARDAPEQHVEADDGIARNAIRSSSRSPRDTGMSRATDQPKRGLIVKRKLLALIFSALPKLSHHSLDFDVVARLLRKLPQMQSKHQPFYAQPSLAQTLHISSSQYLF
jgi:hypothetical protein